MKISELYGLKVFTTTGKELGKVEELIINLEDKKVERILFIPYSQLLKGNARQLLAKNSIKYEKVKSVGDVVIVQHA